MSVLSRDCSVTRRASAHCWVGNGFEFWPKLRCNVYDIKTVHTAAMSGVRQQLVREDQNSLAQKQAQLNTMHS